MNKIEKADYFQFLDKWFKNSIDINVSSPTLDNPKIITTHTEDQIDLPE